MSNFFFPSSPNLNIANESPRMESLNISGSEYGKSIPIVMGSMRLSTNLVWCMPVREEVLVTTETHRTGGKGGGGGGKTTVTTTSYHYYGTFSVMLCRANGGQLLNTSQDRVVRIWADKTVIWQNPNGQRHMSGSLVGGGSFEYRDGVETQAPSSIMQSFLGAGNTPGYRDRQVITFDELPLEKYNNRYPLVEVELSSGIVGIGTTLSEIVRAVTRACGIPESKIDLSAVNVGMRGVRLETAEGSRTLSDLMDLYAITASMTASGLTFKPQRSTIVATIPFEDLGGDGNLDIQYIREEKLPAEVAVTFIEPARDYQPANIISKRQFTSSRQVSTLNVPIALTSSEAFTLADNTLYRAWVARVTYGPFQLTRKYLFLETGDVIEVDDGFGKRHVIQITKIQIGVNFNIQVEGEAYDAAIKDSQIIVPDPDYENSGLPDIGNTYWHVLDIPNFTGNEVDRPGVYIAATGTGVEWRTAGVEISIDNINWLPAAFIPVYSIMGETETKLDDPPSPYSPMMWDETSTVQIRLSKGSLQSVTKEQVMEGANMILIEREILQFRNAQLIAPLTYVLSGLLRGRRNTEAYMFNHDFFERVVLLSGLTFIPIQQSDVARQHYFRLSPQGTAEQFLDDILVEGYNAHPFAPVGIDAHLDLDNDVHFTFYPRTRIGTELPQVGTNPSDTTPEQYEVEIYDAIGSSVVKRRLWGGTPDILYPNSLIISDFGQVPTRLDVSVMQQSVAVNNVGFKSPIITVPKRKFELNFQTNKFYLPGLAAGEGEVTDYINFSRQSMATAYMSDNRLAYFSNNKPCITDQGLLLETAKTNYVNSQNINITGLQNIFQSLPNTISVVNDQAALEAAGLYGFTDVYKVTPLATGVHSYSLMTTAGPLLTHPFTLSLYIRSEVTSTIPIRIRCANTGNGQRSYLLTSSYQRILNNITVEIPNGNKRLEVLATSPGTPPFYFCLMQAEADALSTPIIGGVGVKNRAATTCTFQVPPGVTRLRVVWGPHGNPEANSTIFDVTSSQQFQLNTSNRPWIGGYIQRIVEE